MTDLNSIPAKEKFGIKETKEVLIAVNEISIVLLVILLDGLQVYKDVKALIEAIKNNPDFRDKIQDAVDNIKMVPAEAGDIDATEMVELISAQIPYIPKLLAAIKKGRAQIPSTVPG